MTISIIYVILFTVPKLQKQTYIMAEPLPPSYPTVESGIDPAIDLDAWLMEPEDPVRTAFFDAAEAYVNGINIDRYTPEELQAWHDSLPPEEAAYYDGQRQFALEASDRHTTYLTMLEEGLEATAPALLRGRLPEDQEALVGGKYILGTNQSGVADASEAANYVEEFKGVDLTGLMEGTSADDSEKPEMNLNQRFLFFDAESEPHAAFSALAGYRGAFGGGRFVAVVPDNGSHPGESLEMLPDMLSQNDELPTDFVTYHGQGMSAVSDKYIAGFVGMDGRYHRNPHFMQDIPKGRPFGVPESDDWL